LSDFRDALSEIVVERSAAGDPDIYLAPAESWVNNTSDLDDGVHLNPAGAAKFADSLTTYVRMQIGQAN
jgi:lysophospholipase L1-like esterase